MATIDVAPDRHDTSGTPERTADTSEVCLACSHPWDAHDVIGTRFCAATIAGALTRGCVCRPND